MRKSIAHVLHVHAHARAGCPCSCRVLALSVLDLLVATSNKVCVQCGQRERRMLAGIAVSPVHMRSCRSAPPRFRTHLAAPATELTPAVRAQMAKEYDLKAFEAAKANLFKDTESLPSLACRRRCVSRPLAPRTLLALAAAAGPFASFSRRGVSSDVRHMSEPLRGPAGSSTPCSSSGSSRPDKQSLPSG
jgi:hypothetical protein